MSTATVQLTDFSGDTLKLKIGEEFLEIQHQLSALKQLLEERQLQTIQHADKIYNIQHIDEANFGFLTGKRAANGQLTKQLLTAMRPYARGADSFMASIEKRRPEGWERSPQISAKAKKIIVYSFVGPIGVQLSKLMAIGKSLSTDAQQKDYLSKCLHIVEHTLDLLCFALLSDLWDQQKATPNDIPDDLYAAIEHRLDYDATFELNFSDQLDLLVLLYRYYQSSAIPLPLPELTKIVEEFQEESSLRQTLTELQDMSTRTHQEQHTLLDCHTTEKLLANFLTHFVFLCAYKMASIREIGYREVRNSAPHFIHRYMALGIDSKAQKDAEKLLYIPDTAYTDAVILFKGAHYKEGINLFPFVIDHNALNFEHGAMISFFKSKRLEDDNLEYFFLESREVHLLEPQGLLGDNTVYEDIFLEVKKRKQLNQDVVITCFQQARDTILNANF